VSQATQVVRSRPRSRAFVRSVTDHWRSWLVAIVAAAVFIVMFVPIIRFMGFDTRGATYDEYRSGYTFGQDLKRSGHAPNCWQEAKQHTWKSQGDLVRAFQLGCDDSQPGLGYNEFDYKSRVNRYVFNND
jgi:hypothetical protein